MNFSATKAIQVPNQGPPPDSFIAGLVAFGMIAGDYVFAQNPNEDDIMGIAQPVLAPNGWTGIQQRRAGLLTALLYDGMFESSGVWTTGVDMESGAGTSRPQKQWEAGAWQVSQNSITLDVPFGSSSPLGTLSALVAAHCGGATDPATFQAAMKADKMLACLYAAWLFRFDTEWSGPCVSGHLAAAMIASDNGATAIAAMNEFASLLAS